MRTGFPGFILSGVTAWKKEKFAGDLSDVDILCKAGQKSNSLPKKGFLWLKLFP